MKDNKTVTIKIDGQEIKAGVSETITQAAVRAGVYIPTLCYYDGIKPSGACRICTVKVKGRLMTACNTQVQDGMEIENDTPELNEMRKTIIDLMFVEGNHFCMFCEKSGDCDLQALAYRYKILAPRFAFEFPKKDVDGTPPKILIDRNRCVLCKRCMHRPLTDSGKALFALSQRGNKTRVEFDDKQADQVTDDMAEKAMSVCPVGALIKKGKGFAVPVGQRKYDKNPIGSEIKKKT